MLWLIALFLLALLTLIGHGIWVLLATIYGVIFPKSKAQRCRHCDRFSSMPGGHCAWCGRAQTAPLNDEAADVAAIGRQLRRWQARGLIQPETVVGLLAKIEAWQRPGARPAAELAELAESEPRTPHESVEPAPKPPMQPQTPSLVAPHGDTGAEAQRAAARCLTTRSRAAAPFAGRNAFGVHGRAQHSLGRIGRWVDYCLLVGGVGH